MSELLFCLIGIDVTILRCLLYRDIEVKFSRVHDITKLNISKGCIAISRHFKLDHDLTTQGLT